MSVPRFFPAPELIARISNRKRIKPPSLSFRSPPLQGDPVAAAVAAAAAALCVTVPVSDIHHVCRLAALLPPFSPSFLSHTSPSRAARFA